MNDSTVLIAAVERLQASVQELRISLDENTQASRRQREVLGYLEQAVGRLQRPH